ncbi:ATP/GTP-binding protein [Streptomyces sp. NPDC052000]|uniref:ATP/GTP-binding protein n=1 Tax=Streptomyces sp. NPDC052000 TaxID=3155676 RepID=UPI003450C65F
MADDLRALFSSNDPSFDANEAFTDRGQQWAIVAAAVDEHLRHVADPAFDVQDLERPRTNVLGFHGVGGVGKSTLLRKLEAALTTDEGRPAQWGAPIWTQRLLPVRVDLARSASTGADFERVILTIRLALTEVGRPLPSFDVALRQYWEHTHPGEPLDEYIRRTGLTGKVASLLPQQMQSAVSEIVGALELPGLVGSAAGQVTAALVTALRSRREHALALAGASRTAALLEAPADLQALSYYPHLLAWDLTRLSAKKRVVPVVLLDTWEDTADRHRDLERLLQRLVWLMPNAFFIISGRNRLQWGDPALHGQLDWTGPTAWPGLDTPTVLPHPRSGAPAGRQHLIGDLAPEDCDTHLARRLVKNGQPLIDPGIRAVITARSHGLPLHLDLAVSRFLEIRRTGRTPAEADFDCTFPALLARTMSDLSPEERHVLRSTALLDAFDLDLATRAAGLTHQAPARRLTERPLVTENPQALWPFHLHAAIRTAVHDDDHSEDRWTPSEWHQAATRALAALGRQWAGAADLGPSRMFLIGCLRQGLRLARDHRLTDLGWLTDAAVAYTSDSIWEPLAPPAQASSVGGEPGLETPADAVAELLTAIGHRQREHREHTVDRLTAVLDTGLLPAALTEMALYYRAKANKDLDRTDAARTGMQQVADAGGRFAAQGRRGLASLARLAGDFPAALAVVPTLGWEGRHHRVLGDILWPHGDFAQAITAFENARTEAEQHDAAGERAMSQVRIALATSFADPVRATDELVLAHQLLDGLDQRANRILAHLAALIADAGSDQGVVGRAHALQAEAEAAGLPYLTRYVELGLALHHAIRGAGHDLAATIGRLQDLTAGGDFGFFTDIAHFMGDLSLPGPSATRWTEGEEHVRSAWRSLVQARRRLLGVGN